VLFDPLEEELYLLPVTIKIGYCLCRDREVVGQEVEDFAGAAVVVFDPS